MGRTAKPKPTPAAAEAADPTQIVRLSSEMHHKLKIISAVEKKSMRELVDTMIGERVDQWFKDRKFTVEPRS